jgi:hypothetical protein
MTTQVTITCEEKLSKISKLYQECITSALDKKDFEIAQGLLNLLRQHSTWKQIHSVAK